MGYYIGVDGGGTKTHFALFNERRELLAEHKGPGSNHETLEGAFEDASEVIMQGVRALMEAAGISAVDFTLMGLAGIDHPFQYDLMRGKLEQKGLERFEIFNDGFLVVKAGSESGAAIGYNCGTGTCCNAIDSRGRILQLAGLGDFSGDVGSGPWIAVKTFRMIYDEVFLGMAKTALTQMVFSRFGLSNREDFLALIPSLETEKSEETLRQFIDIFFEALNADDPQALAVAREMAQRAAHLISAHIRQLDFEGEAVEVVLAGSIHTKLPSGKYVEMIRELIPGMCGREARFRILDKAPVYGCINWILQDYIEK
ncbi:MAG TPA: BadF/BadG/BcrA/BcrD ATPase family protein [Clostridiales bacterium]|nr:MAG: BadF/BadG/BcrA/BcrD ATPase family protein [Firmicutes bacterium ADurb.Bin262]HOU11039.1 BadF/BadG/BcrA/BcrD ATPase family protein [Clostridiales bacterium]HQK74446.1 BadF/BadG/BcrA/BcrD ATPase family protein [Clostridiales bacterium]